MHITFTTLSGTPSFLDLYYPKEFGSSTELQKRKSIVNTGSGEISIKETWFEGACLFCSDFKTSKPCHMQLHCNSFCWIMNFVLDGEIDSSFGPDNELVRMQKGKYNLLYSATLNANLMINRPASALTICLTRRFIRKLLGKDILPENFEGGGNEPLTLVSINELLDNRLHLLIKEIMQAAQPDYIRRIFLESKILEMLSLQLERLENKQTMRYDFNDADIARLNEAKKIIESNLQTPCSLIELARKTGLNDFKLKKGFKALFNNTVFGYLATVRMEKAYQLLQDGSTVSEVAEIVGYKNPHHFTAAFKKKFLVLPSQISKVMMVLFSCYNLFYAG